MVPITAARAESNIVVDPNQVGNTAIGTTASGLTQVDIATPSGAGVSHNQFTDYNVAPEGIILNNAAGLSQTDLAGMVYGNPNLGAGSASIILNEVTGTADSLLQGYSEVAGAMADVIVANPNGVTCAGCGFINTSRVTLSTGVPDMVDGDLRALVVEDGTVAFRGAGGDFSAVPFLDVVARRVELAGPLHGQDIDVLAGRNRYLYADGSHEALAPDGRTPQIAIDSSAFGGMYAGRISLIANEAGAGVSLDGTLAANADSLSITTDGQLVMTGRLSAAEDLAVEVEELTNSGAMVAAQDLSLQARTITNETAGEILAQTGNLRVAADIAVNRGRIAAVEGNASVTAETLQTTGSGVIAAGRDLAVEVAEELDNDGRLVAGHTLELTAGRLNNAAEGAVLSLAGSLDIEVAREAVNAGELYAAQNVAIAGGALRNQAGGEIVSNAGDISVTLAARLTNEGDIRAGDSLSLRVARLSNRGRIAALRGAARIAAADMTNADAALIAAGTRLEVAVADSLANAGRLFALDDLSLTVGDLDNAASGAISSRDGAVSVTADAVGNAGRIASSSGALQLSARSLDNRDGGLIAAGSGLTAIVTGGLTNAGQLYALSGLTARAATLNNLADGDIVAENGLLEVGGGTLVNDGDLLSGGALALGLGGGLVNRGVLQAAGPVMLSLAGGALNDGGRIESRTGALNLAAASLDNRGAALLARQGLLSLALQQDATNRGGQIAGGGVALSAARLTNDALIAAVGGSLEITLSDVLTLDGGALESATGDLRVTAAGLDNSAALVAGRDLLLSFSGDAVNRGLLMAQRNLGISLAGSLNNAGGAVMAETGDLVIEGATAGSQATRVANRSGLIEATQGDILIRAQSIDNLLEGGVQQSSQRVFDAFYAAQNYWRRVQTRPSGCGHRGEEPCYRDYLEGIPEYRDIPGHPGHNNAEQYYNRPDRWHVIVPDPHRGYDYAVYYFFRTGMPSSAGVRVFADQVSFQASGAQSLISAGGNLTLDAGAIRNDASHILARGDMTLTGQSLANTGYSSQTQWYIDCENDDLCRTVGGRGAPWQDAGLGDTAPKPWFREDGPGLSGTIRAGGAIAGSFTGRVDNETIVARANLVGLPGFSGTVPTVATPSAPTGPAAGVPALSPATLSGAAPGLPGFGVPATGAPTPTAVSAQDLLADISGGRGLFVANAEPGFTYLIESRYEFAALSGFYGSQYFLDRLDYDPDRLPPFLGDAFFETRYVLQQVLDVTGQRYLGDYADDGAQMRGLFDAAAAQAQDLNLVPGVALTAEQVAGLTSSIVWYEEVQVAGQRVLAPRLYLAGGGLDQIALDGGRIAGTQVALEAAGLTNSGDLLSDDNLAITVLDELANLGGRIAAEGAASLVSLGGSIVNSATVESWEAQTGSVEQILSAGRIESGGDLSLSAAQDLVSLGSQMNSGGDLRLAAGGDVTFGAIATRQETAYGGSQGGKSISVAFGAMQQNGSSVTSGGALTVLSGEDITFGASTAIAEGDLLLAAEGLVTLTAAEETSYYSDSSESSGFLSSSSSWSDSESRTLRSSFVGARDGALTIAGGEGIGLFASEIAAGNDAQLLAGYLLDSTNGVFVEGGGEADLIVQGGTEASHDGSGGSRSGLFAGSGGGFVSFYGASERSERTWSETNLPSLLSAGGSLTAAATGDIAVQGSHVAAGEDIALAAAGNLTVAPGREGERREERESRSGFGIGFSADEGGIGLSVGLQVYEAGEDFEGDYNAVSTLSAGRDLNLSAGEDLTLVATRATAGDDLVLSGENVSLLAALDRETLSGFERELFVGITASVNQNVSQAARTVADSVSSTAGAEGGAGATLISGASGALRSVDAVTSALSSPVSASVGFGVSGSNRSWSRSSETAVPTVLQAGDDLTIAASDTLLARGAQVSAGDRVLLSAETLRLEAQAARSTSSHDSSHFGASVGVSYGFSTGLTSGAPAGWGSGLNASVSGGFGESESEATRHLWTQVTGRSVDLEVGGDAALIGAVVAGERVRAAIGGDLEVVTVADLSSSRNRSRGASLGISMGLGGPSGRGPVSLPLGVSFGEGERDSAWMDRQAGFLGADVSVEVGGHTRLEGGYIAGDLTTGSLSWADLEGHDRGRQVDLSLSGSLPLTGGGGNSEGLLPDWLPTVEGGFASHAREQVARATVTGDVTVTDPDAQAQDLAALNRDPDRALEVTKDERTSFDVYVSPQAINEVAAGFPSFTQAAQNLVAELRVLTYELPPEAQHLGEGLEDIAVAMIRNGLSSDEVNALLLNGDMLESLTTLIDVVGQIGSLEDLKNPDLREASQMLSRTETGAYKTKEGPLLVGIVEGTPPSAGEALLRSLGEVAQELQSWPEPVVTSTFLALDVALGGPFKAAAGQVVDAALDTFAGEELSAALEFAATHLYALVEGTSYEEARDDIAERQANGTDAFVSRDLAGAKLLVAALVPAIVPAGKSIKDAVAPKRGNAAVPDDVLKHSVAPKDWRPVHGAGAQINTPKGFTSYRTPQGDLVHVSPSGLKYGRDEKFGNRVDHVLDHTHPNPGKPVHTVFNVQGDDALALVDEAWGKRGASVPGDPGAFVVDMGRPIGTTGETSIRVIVKPGTSEIITAYPQ
ncbi:hemagglutinin repeat-containing protein [Algihabitans albus]|uniref:hemagglutinin repeat-containing protein n=1 Tax=Algihabitans albus TaxID=2164067 RepID=UPI0013C2F9F2|nr:hemagglutinin repeat-containing protein [Algihabitans albus]